MSTLGVQKLKRLFPNVSASTLARNPERDVTCWEGMEKAGFQAADEIVKALPPEVTAHSIVKAKMDIERKQTDEEKLNKTERGWLAVLRERNYPFIGIQCMTLKLGDDCRYTPDFITIDPNGELVAWETKGFFRDDAKVKSKVAARQFFWIVFVVVTKGKRGTWVETEVKP